MNECGMKIRNALVFTRAVVLLTLSMTDGLFRKMITVLLGTSLGLEPDEAFAPNTVVT